MKILVFDTSFSSCSVAVIKTSEPAAKSARTQQHPGRTLASIYEPMETGQAICLMPMIRQVMAQGNVTFDDLDAIATSPGPGTFTGVRIAVATARALALSTGLPVLGFSSLALIAAKAASILRAQPEDQVIAATMDARRGALYIQLFKDPKEPPLTTPRLLEPHAAARLISKTAIAVATGAKDLKSAAALDGLSIISKLEDLQPDATFSNAIHMEHVNTLRPLYLRPPDAKPQAGKTIPRV